MEELKQFLETASENLSHRATEISRTLQSRASESGSPEGFAEGGIDFVIDAICEALGS
jgi:hypothetical protein